MPQIVLEYTNNVGLHTGHREFFASVHRVLSEVGGIPLANCKSRALKLEDFHIADGGPNHAFAHLDVRFVEGRAPDVKHAIGTALLHVLEEHVRESTQELDLQLTVEIGDIRRDSYFKLPEGTLADP